MKTKMYTSYYNFEVLEKTESDTQITAREIFRLTENKMGDAAMSKSSYIKNFLVNDYFKLATLGFLIDFANKSNCKNIISLGAGSCVMEYFLKCALPDDSFVAASDFDGFLIGKARQFFPEISAFEFDLFKDRTEELKNRYKINFDLAVFLGSAYVMDDEDFITQFSGLKKIGVKRIIDFHAGFYTDKEAFMIGLGKIKSAMLKKFKNIGPVKYLWEKIKTVNSPETSIKSKFHGYGRTKGEILKLYKKSGLSVVKEFRVGHYRYAAILQ